MKEKRSSGHLKRLGAVLAVGCFSTSAWAAVGTLNITIADKNGNLVPSASVGYRINNGGLIKAVPGGYAKWVIKNPAQKISLEVQAARWGSTVLEAELPSAPEVSIVVILEGKEASLQITPPRGGALNLIGKSQPQALQSVPAGPNSTSRSKPRQTAVNFRGPGTCGGGGDCCTATPTIPGCMDIACCTAVCTCDAFCCDVEWDAFCAGDGFVPGCGAAALCAACMGPPCDVICPPGSTPENEPDCGIPSDTVNGGCNGVPAGGSNCCFAHAGPGCDNPACQAAVCGADSFCCDVEWDGLCAGAAATLCDPLCDVSSFPFSPIACGQTYCGTSAFDGALRDTDWYQITVAAPTEFTWTVEAEFDVLLGMVETSPLGTPDCATATALDPFATVGPCTSASVTRCVPPGTYWWFVAPQFLAPVACGAQYTATLTCVGCDAPEPPANETCATAEPIAVGGSDSGSTELAAPDAAPFCGTSVDGPGVWYSVVGDGTTLTVSLCNPGTTYDTKVHVYCPACDNLNCAAGDDDFCGFPPGHSQVSFCSAMGQTYFILVEGFGGATGNYELSVTSDALACNNPPSCMGVCGSQGGDCCDATPGIAGCMDATCCQTVCAIDPFCCEVEWDGICADEAGDLCPACAPPPCDIACAPGSTPENEPDCGIPSDTVNGGCNGVPAGGSNCCFAHAGPGCDNAACQAAVCAADSFCCDVEWDGLCAGAAASLCDPLCDVASFPFSHIACGQTYCSTSAFDGALRDTDWYDITVASETEFTWCLTGGGAEFEWLIGMVETSPLGTPDCATATALDPFLVGDRCTTGCVTRCVPPGTYWWFVAPQFADLVPCGAEYQVALTCAPCDAPEPPDNDLCADATPLALPADVSGSTDLASLDPASFPTCGTAGPPSAPGVWYSVAGTGHTISASLCNPGTNYDTKISVYCPDCATPSCVVGDDDACGFPPGFSQVSWCSQIGATYLILVHGFGGATGNFQLTVTDGGSNCTPPTGSCLPPEPTGGCCVAGVCSIQTQSACTLLGGLYLGDGTDCDPPGGTVYTDMPNMAIPDNLPAGASDTMNVPDSISITDLNVDLVITHTWVGDLTVTLAHGATSVVILDRPGVPASTFGCASDNYNIILDDEGAGGPIETLCAPVMTSPPNYVPQNPLSAFDGQNVQGIWTITVADGAASDTGTLVQWSLHLPGAGSVCEPAGACCIHPNCVIDTEADCLAAGGFYLGDNITCTIAGPAHDYVAGGLNLAIPDNLPAGVNHVINVPDVFNVEDLNVDVVITHTWVGDLKVTLNHGATTQTLIDRPGVPASTFGCANDNYNIILDDEGTGGTIEALCAVSMTSPPNYTPNNPLSAFDGAAANGAWTINVSDGAASDTGTLTQWSLHFAGASTPACEFPGACCNRMTGQCNNGVLEEDCVGDWYKNETCDEIQPPCQVCGNGIVEGTEECDGGACCDPDCTYASPATVCRPSAGVCDAAESCTGNSAVCPPDGFAGPATVCRPSAGVCDVPENCPGNGVNCPADGFATAATVCRPSAGVCDVVENCTGTGVACPADGFVAAGTECRPEAGICDDPEACTGSSAACPADAFNNVDLCRPVAGPCDLPENCNGSGTACPPDSFTSGGECRPSTGECDPAEDCDGSGAACPPDGTITACGPDDGCCPNDNCFSDVDGDDDCPSSAIPTVSEWGLVVLTLLLLVGWKVYFGRQRETVTA